MERDGLVALAPSPDDKRVRVLSPTKLGQKRYGVAKSGAQKLEAALRRAYGDRMTDDLAASVPRCCGGARRIVTTAVNVRLTPSVRVLHLVQVLNQM